jgi:Polyketide cyclase / dehydrase and lipid transport
MSQYHFTTRWQFEATREEIFTTLQNAEDLPRWWPSVYLDTKIREKGSDDGVGKVVELYTKGWLPYTLVWKLRVLKTEYPRGYSIEALGDFVGNGVWTFTQISPKTCEVVYDWKIRAEKPFLKLMTPFLKPIFSANHLWAMRKGEESLRLELQRRRTVSLEEKMKIPAPTMPTFPHNLLNNRILN